MVKYKAFGTNKFQGNTEWGTNGFGRSFTTAVTQPLIVRQDCDFRLTSGIVTHATPVFNAVVLFVLNASGNPIPCPGTGNYFKKIVWTGPGRNTHKTLLPY